MNKITVQELNSILSNLNAEIQNVIHRTAFGEYEDWSGIRDFENITDPNELQLLDEYKTVMQKLTYINSAITYMNRPVIQGSTLFLNAQGNYEDEYHIYHCGDSIEFYFYDEWNEKYKWRESRIEHNGERYYIVGNPNVELNGLSVRYRKSRQTGGF